MREVICQQTAGAVGLSFALDPAGGAAVDRPRDIGVAADSDGGVVPCAVGLDAPKAAEESLRTRTTGAMRRGLNRMASASGGAPCLDRRRWCESRRRSSV